MRKVVDVQGLFKRGFGISLYPSTFRGALLFKRCTSIHTFWLSAPIAIWAFDKQFNLVLQDSQVQPNQIRHLPKKTHYLFEVYSDCASQYDTLFFINFLKGII